MLTNCGRCNWKYPDSLLNQMFIVNLGEKGGYTKPICGLCALELTNEAHAIKRIKFDGEIAEHMRLLAKKWRKSNPKFKPSEEQK
jgi:hypothetical protein